MINVLIILALMLLVLLLGIKYGLLQVIAIVLAVVALIPFATSTILYFVYTPTITYQIANKSKEAISDDKYQYKYDFWLAVSVKKGYLIFNKLWIAPEWGFLPDINPSSTEGILLGNMIPETGSISTFGIDGKQRPIFPKSGVVHILRLKSVDDKEYIKAKIIIDTEVDPMKLGFWSIFQPNYRYRQMAEVIIDFKEKNRQEGQFKRQL